MGADAPAAEAGVEEVERRLHGRRGWWGRRGTATGCGTRRRRGRRRRSAGGGGAPGGRRRRRRGGAAAAAAPERGGGEVEEEGRWRRRRRRRWQHGETLVREEEEAPCACWWEPGRHLFGFGSGRRSGLGSGAGASTFADKVLDEALVLTNVFLADAEASELFEERLPCGIDVLGAEAVLCGEAHVGDVLEAGWSTDHGLVDLSAGGCLLLFEEEEEEDFDLAYLERFETFLKSSLASDSSAKEKPIKQESPSKEWKKVRSWLYWKPS